MKTYEWKCKVIKHVHLCNSHVSVQLTCLECSWFARQCGIGTQMNSISCSWLAEVSFGEQTCNEIINIPVVCVMIELGLIHESSCPGSCAKEVIFGQNFQGWNGLTTFLLLRRWWTNQGCEFPSVNLPNARFFCEIKGKHSPRNMLSINAMLQIKGSKGLE